MKPALHLALIASFLLTACASARLSSDEARRRIAAIGRSSLVPDAVEVRRIVSQSSTSAVAESTVTLAFQFKRATENADWRIDAVRLGDRDWISLDELLAAVNEGRRRTSEQSLQQLSEGIRKYQASNGSLPPASDIVRLTDILYPGFMNVLVREDGWGSPIIYEVSGATGFRLVSLGPDRARGTADDVVVEPGGPGAP
jgi:hypothetical protein